MKLAREDHHGPDVEMAAYEPDNNDRTINYTALIAAIAVLLSALTGVFFGWKIVQFIINIGGF